MTKLDPLDDRTLVAVFIPAVFLGLLLVEAALSAGPVSRPVTAAVTTAVIALVAYHVAAAIYLATPGGQLRLAGFEGPRWAQSALLAHLRSEPLTGPLFSNEPAAVYYRTGQVVGEVGSREFASMRESATVLWFRERSPRSFEAFRRAFALEPLVALDDGTIFRISQRPD